MKFLLVILVQILTISNALADSCEADLERKKEVQAVANRMAELQSAPKEWGVHTRVKGLANIKVGNIGSKGLRPEVVCNFDWENEALGVHHDLGAETYCGVILEFDDQESLVQFAYYTRFTRVNTFTVTQHEVPSDDDDDSSSSSSSVSSSDPVREYTAHFCAKVK